MGTAFSLSFIIFSNVFILRNIVPDAAVFVASTRLSRPIVT